MRLVGVLRAWGLAGQPKPSLLPRRAKTPTFGNSSLHRTSSWQRGHIRQSHQLGWGAVSVEGRSFRLGDAWSPSPISIPHLHPHPSVVTGAFLSILSPNSSFEMEKDTGHSFYVRVLSSCCLLLQLPAFVLLSSIYVATPANPVSFSCYPDFLMLSSCHACEPCVLLWSSC